MTQINIYATETDSSRIDWWLPRGTVVAKGDSGMGVKTEFGVSRHTLLSIGWINNKVLLYSTGIYIQYPVTKHNGKEY